MPASSSATSFPVAGARLNPSMLCPVARVTLGFRAGPDDGQTVIGHGTPTVPGIGYGLPIGLREVFLDTLRRRLSRLGWIESSYPLNSMVEPRRYPSAKGVTATGSRGRSGRSGRHQALHGHGIALARFDGSATPTILANLGVRAPVASTSRLAGISPRSVCAASPCSFSLKPVRVRFSKISTPLAKGFS